MDKEAITQELKIGELIFDIMTPDERKNVLQLTSSQLQRISNQSNQPIQVIFYFIFLILINKLIINIINS